MYYVLDRSYAKHPARITDRASYDLQDVWWNDGSRFTTPIRTPVEVRLRPFDINNPNQSAALPIIFKGPVPLYRDDLLRAIRDAGADNIDAYDAHIIDPDSGAIDMRYKAVNILGMMAAADLSASIWRSHDGIPLVDVEFDKLVLDPARTRAQLIFRLAENNSAVLVHRRLRDSILAAGINELEFYDLGEVAL